MEVTLPVATPLLTKKTAVDTGISTAASIGNKHYHTRGKVSKRDGVSGISLKDTSNTGYLAKALLCSQEACSAQASIADDEKALTCFAGIFCVYGSRA